MLARTTPALRALARSFSSTPAVSADTHTFQLRQAYKYHKLDGVDLPMTVEANKEDMLKFFRDMYTVRRMEIGLDNDYKARKIRGFCHLYDGQEAVAVGIEGAISKEDNIITSYRCHGIQYLRGTRVRDIAAELYGFSIGCEKGKGGSMHLYSKKNKFWGGSGIVGAQVPVGVGVAFAEQYKARLAAPGGGAALPARSHIGISMYGDGAANQGQIYEAVNMAKLWSIPALFICENNQYGMGTSTARSSMNPNYYTQGGEAVPGIQIDGMDVLAVRQAVRWAREWAATGKGPLFLEMKTYRYHGHSMSDPGISYRDREEVANVRASRDCIDQLKGRIIEAGWATAEDLKALEKQIRGEVQAEFDLAGAGAPLPEDAIYDDIYAEGRPPFVRGTTFEKSASF